MKTLLRSLLILFLILSPYFFGLLLITIKPMGGLADMALGLHLLYYIPFILITGMIVSLIVRKKPQADKLSLLGYGVPAVLTWLHELTILL